MTKHFLLLVIFFGTMYCGNAQTQTHTLKVEGVYKEIDVAQQNKVIDALSGQNKTLKQQAIDDVLRSPNNYNPPVLYALSRELFNQGKGDDAAFWFYTAQLRARYDANLCTDESAGDAVHVLNMEYGPDINKYAMQDMDRLAATVKGVVDFVRSNNENYDHRWINLHGMDAVMGSMDSKSPPDKRELSKPQDQWPAIKKKTIDDYYNGFIEAVKNKKK